MFCKYCGKPIDPGTMRCRACGRPVGPLEGGNGFWDLTGEAPAPAAPAQDPAIPELEEQVKALRAELAARPAQKKGGFAAAAGILLALLGIAGCFFTLNQVKDLSGQLRETEQRLEQMGERIAALEARPVPEEKPVQTVFFTRQPTDAAPELNKAVQDEYSDNGVWLFEASFEGSYGPYLWYWEKVEGDPEDPEYTRVGLLEGDLFEEITVTNKDGDKSSRLYSRGPIRREHAGVYVFTVEDYEHNFHRSDPVTLTVLKNGKPYATPAPFVGQESGTDAGGETP